MAKATGEATGDPKAVVSPARSAATAGTRLALVAAVFLVVGVAEQILARNASAVVAASLTGLTACAAGFWAWVASASAARAEEKRLAWQDRSREAFARLRRSAMSASSVGALSEELVDTLSDLFELNATVWIAGSRETPPLPLKLLEPLEDPVLLAAPTRQNGVRPLVAAALSRARVDGLVLLRSHDRVIGMVTMRGERGVTLSQEQSDVLRSLTVLAATAIECARLHDELARSTVVVARANRLASLGLLTAGLAHEVRNPLVALRTFAQLLPERWDNAEFRREFGSVVLSEIDRMHLLMNDVLRFARRGPEPEEAGSLAEVVASLVPLLKVQADKKGVELLFDQETETPNVAAEVAAVRQVTMNLVLNAIDATPAGGRIRIGCGGRCDAGQRRAVLRVSDSGPGIAPEHLPLIFEPFFTTRTEGTGLGLAITHQIVRDHGGTIDVQSGQGAGTTFRVELPVAESSAPIAVAGTARVGGAGS